MASEVSGRGFRRTPSSARWAKRRSAQLAAKSGSCCNASSTSRCLSTGNSLYTYWSRVEYGKVGIIVMQGIRGHLLPQVNQRVAHAAQGRVDAYAGCVGNFLEAHVAVVAHQQYLLLGG